MFYVIIGIITLVIVIIFAFLIKLFLNKVNVYTIKINEAVKNIDLLLEKKINLLTKIKDKLKENIEENFMDKLPKIKNQNLDSFELDAEIELMTKELKEILEYNKKVILDDETNILLRNLDRASIDLIATKNYYNDNSEIYNNIISKFPTSIIAKIKRYDQLDFYENKKEEEFEILKEK